MSYFVLLSTDASSDDVPRYSIEWAPDDEDEPRDIMDEIQLKRFIRVLQTAQTLAQGRSNAEENDVHKKCTMDKSSPGGSEDCSSNWVLPSVAKLV